MTLRPGLKALLILVVCLALGWVYYRFNPASAGSLFPPCPSHWLTGYNCPGCGSQRAVHCLLHGDVAQAFRYNALMVVSVPIVLVLMAADVLHERYPRFYNVTHHYVVCIAYFVVAVAWTVVRNIYGW